MIVANCPLRISLFGGSSDNPKFVSKYGMGQVISFTCDLKTYVTISEDKLGFNNDAHKYIMNYSRHEEVEKIYHIQNEVIRVVLEHFNIPPVTVSLTSDIYSQGSGLASSSSYLISLIKACCIHKNINMSDIEICRLAYELELKFNPNCGYQDPYGCGIGGFKHLRFYEDGRVSVEFLESDIFNKYDTSLIFTGITRNSKEILNDVSKNIEKIQPLVKLVDDAKEAIVNKKYDRVFELLEKNWTEKKKTSKMITENKTISSMDRALSINKTVLSHKLCGAGNGGFFLVFSEKEKLDIPYKSIKVKVCNDEIRGNKL